MNSWPKFDFEVNSLTGILIKRGIYSKAKTREATREEALLWNRVQELELSLDALRSNRVRLLLERIPQESGTLTLSASNFAALRQQAPDIVDMEESPSMVRRGLLGVIHWQDEEGRPHSIWIRVQRGADFSFEPAE